MNSRRREKRHHKDIKDKRHHRSHRRKDSFDKIPINDINRINKSKREYIPKDFRVKIINKDPYIVKIKNFLTSREVKELVKLAEKNGFERSNIVIDNKLIYDEMRTSKTSYLLEDGCPYKYSKNIENLIKRICYLMDCKREQIEGLMCVKYEGGEYFETHVDFFSTDDVDLLEDAGNRIFTFFAYLNNVDRGEGGETEFPQLEIKSRPVKGDAIGWWNFVRGEKKRNTLHRGLPPTEGHIKYGLNIWIREKSFF